MTWVVAVAGTILFGVTIAVLATPQMPSPVSPPSVASPTTAPTSATTITSASPQPVESSDPADTVITTPQPAKKTAPSTTVTSGAVSAPAIKTAPREDFIRDL
jgi:hypothetical protein